MGIRPNNQGSFVTGILNAAELISRTGAVSQSRCHLANSAAVSFMAHVLMVKTPGKWSRIHKSSWRLEWRKRASASQHTLPALHSSSNSRYTVLPEISFDERKHYLWSSTYTPSPPLKHPIISTWHRSAEGSLITGVLNAYSAATGNGNEGGLVVIWTRIRVQDSSIQTTETLDPDRDKD